MDHEDIITAVEVAIIITTAIQNFSTELEALTPETLADALGNEPLFESISRSELVMLCEQGLAVNQALIA